MVRSFIRISSIVFLLILNLVLAKVVFAIELTAESNTVTTSIGNPPVTTAGDISSCTFYRSGDPVDEAKIGNPQMAAFITEVAGKVGVPPAILAGILRVESAQALITKDTSYFANDYDEHKSNVGATGAMQFMPGTFEGVYRSNQQELASLFQKTGVRSVVDPQGSDMANNQNMLRIYSVKDSIIAAAFKTKNDAKGRTWDLATLNIVLGAYYGCTPPRYPNCNTGPYNYAEDVWKSYQNCQPRVSATGKALCPVPKGPNQDGTITCGPSRPIKTSYPACNEGHCSGDYGFPGWCQYTATNYAVDIPGRPNQDVYLPELTMPDTGDVHPISCESKFVGNRGDYNGAQAILPFSCRDEVTGGSVWIQFHHMLPSSALPLGTRITSGDVVGKIEPDLAGRFPHAHVQIGINGECWGTNTAACVGADKYLQCK